MNTEMGGRYNTNLDDPAIGKTPLFTPQVCAMLDDMKRFASSVASWICGLLLATISIPSALANADYTYKFTADPGQVTWYNDTTVEINESQLPPNDFPPPDLWFSLVSINVLADIDMGA